MANEKLTNEELVYIDTVLGMVGRTAESYSDGLPAMLYEPSKERVFLNKLTASTIRRMEQHYAKKKKRKPYTFKKGTRHHNRKKATARRLRAKRWATDPFSCFIHGYGSYAVDRKLWDKHIAPIWTGNNPPDLQIKKYGSPFGSRSNPYTVYSFDIVHTPTGSVLYNGNSQYLYDLGDPSVCTSK